MPGILNGTSHVEPLGVVSVTCGFDDGAMQRKLAAEQEEWESLGMKRSWLYRHTTARLK